MLPTPETSVWSSSARLTPVRRRRSAATKAVVVEGRVERVAGDVRDRRRHASGRRRPGASTRQAAERALVDEAQLAGRRRRSVNRTRRCVSSGASGRLHQQLAAHAEVADEQRRRRPSSGEPQVLAAAAARRRPCGRSGAAAKSAGAGEVPADGARVRAPRRRRSVRPTTQRSQAAPDDLDLGQLGHAASAPASRARRRSGRRRAAAAPVSAARPSRRPPARPPSCCGRCPSPSASPPTTRPRRVNVFAWSGPLSLDLVLGHAEAAARR